MCFFECVCLKSQVGSAAPMRRGGGLDVWMEEVLMEERPKEGMGGGFRGVAEEK